jgi:preprotein translocase subunit SecE
MGKVRDDAPASSSPKPAAGKPAQPTRSTPGRLVQFLANFLRADRYKPNQGKLARLWTAIGLGLVLAAGLYTYQQRYLDDLAIIPRYAVPLAIAAAFAWIVWRIVEFPPFADFLIATEAEMNKVSWISREELRRATAVVLMTVLILSLFLFGVDWLWSFILKLLGVLQIDGGGGFGSQA